ncbi:MAG TPA: hypothetical protein VLA48_00325 [Nitrososphaeraceae archaeon]|nr:hypothetical protein [Nitrososphaeraceae archaeon]
MIQDLGIVYKQPKLELEKGNDYEEKKNKIDRYKKVSSALFKKRFYWDLKMNET